MADVIITDEHSADSPQLKKLIHNTAKNFTIGEVSADTAYPSSTHLFKDMIAARPLLLRLRGWQCHTHQYQRDQVP